MKNMITLIPHAKPAFFTGAGVFLVTILFSVLMVQIYTNSQARQLVSAMSPAVRTLCFAIITSSSTIIPLLLAILGFTRRLDDDVFDREFYSQIKAIAILGTVALISATLLLLFVSMPIQESDELRAWFIVVYYVLVIGSAWIAALLVSMVVILYNTLIGFINLLNPYFTESPE